MGVATMSTTGLGTSVSAGSTTITALSSSISGSTTLTVQAAAQLPFSVVQLAAQRNIGLSTDILNESTSGDYGITCAVSTNNENCNLLAMSTLGANHGIVLLVIGGSNTNSVTGCTSSPSGSAFTLIPSAHCSLNENGMVGFADILYLPNSTAGDTSVTCKLTQAATDSNLQLYELNQSIHGADVIGTPINNLNAPGGGSIPGISLTTVNPYDFVTEIFEEVNHNFSGVSSPWQVYTTPLGVAYTIPYIATNNTTGTYQPTWTTTGFSNYCVSAAAFHD